MSQHTCSFPIQFNHHQGLHTSPISNTITALHHLVSDDTITLTFLFKVFVETVTVFKVVSSPQQTKYMYMGLGLWNKDNLLAPLNIRPEGAFILTTQT